MQKTSTNSLQPSEFLIDFHRKKVFDRQNYTDKSFVGVQQARSQFFNSRVRTRATACGSQ